MDRSRAFGVALCGLLLAAAALSDVAAQDVKDATGLTIDLPPIELSNNKGMKVTILPFGAIIQRMIVPDKNGNPVDVALGMNKASEYLVSALLSDSDRRSFDRRTCVLPCRSLYKLHPD